MKMAPGPYTLCLSSFVSHVCAMLPAGAATVSAAQPSTAVEPMGPVVPEATVLSSLVVPSDASVTPGKHITVCQQTGHASTYSSRQEFVSKQGMQTHTLPRQQC